MQINKLKSFIKQSSPFLIATLSFTILVVSALSYTNSKKDSWEKDVKARLFEILMTKKTKLEKALYSRIHYTKSVAAYVSLKPDISIKEYYNLANELINNDSVICTMGLAENCIIGAVFPLKGHEEAIGLNLLAHPERNEIVQKTIKTRESFIAGPVELMEGGLAFISYTPIFDKTIDEYGVFWGVTDIVIYQKQLLEQANMFEYESGFLFALRGNNGLGNEGAIWWGGKNVFDQNPVTVDIDIPNGNWVLAAVPKIGWASYLNQDRVLLILLIASSFIISILIWLLSRGMVKIRRNELEFRELNATKDKFFSIIAHDLKSPFNSILGFSDLIIEENYNNNEEVEKYANIIKNSSKTTIDLLLNLMEWSRSQTGRMKFSPEDIEMNSLINETKALLNESEGLKSISISNELPRNLTVFADKAMLATIMRNLISNALKFTNIGGKIIISALQNNEGITISVRDNGLGIKKDAFEKIFRIEENYSTKGTQNETGTGLGLILCKEFVKKHGGNIWVESELGKGSDFKFTLPLIKP